MEKKEFERLVKEAVISLPKPIQEKIENVAIVVSDKSASNIKNNKRVIGLYQGIPKTVWGRGLLFRLPDKITIFQKTIEEIASSKEEIRGIIKRTIWHEVAHHFGFNEEEVQRWERKKRD